MEAGVSQHIVDRRREEVPVKMLSPGRTTTGFEKRSGRRADPESQWAVQARCSSVQRVAVSVGHGGASVRHALPMSAVAAG